ncbi:MAG TPA: LL-diaminopimelate aminotransferase [Anaerolineae bacterium]|nr:LL-diaminopimelate aminotransferase [Anaerolineae bacterium]
MKVANRIDSLPPYVFARLGDRLRELAAQGQDIIRLDIGSPDLPPPDFIVDALERSAREPSKHGYGGYYGTPQLRRAMATYYEQRFGVQLHPDKQVVPLIGSKEGIANAALAFVDPGDVVLVPDPGYPTYALGTLLAGGTPYCFPLPAEQGFVPDLNAIPQEMARAAKILWLNYPNNPTGGVASLAFFEEAVAFARRYDLLICHDNPYCDVTFDDYEAPSLLQVPGAVDVTLEFNSLSKTYNMAGWRVGMAVGSQVAVSALANVKTNIDSGMFLAIQDASVLALTGDQGWLRERNETYRQRRDMILQVLPALGMEAAVPKASLYIWARVPKGYSSTDYATRVLEEAAVSITPGNAFGDQGEGYVRLSLGMSTARIQEAIERLEKITL